MKRPARTLKHGASKTPYIRQGLAAERRHSNFIESPRTVVVGARIRGASSMRCQCEEPNLNDLIADPMIRTLMARDAVAEADLRRLFDRVRDRFVHGTQLPGAALNRTH